MNGRQRAAGWAGWLACAVSGALLAAPPATRPVEGIASNTPQHVALVNARIVAAPGEVIERGSIVLRDGRIVSVGRGETVPPGAERRDLAGKTVFAGFIEPLARVGVPAALREDGDGNLAESGPRHWNPRVRPERDLAAMLDIKDDEVTALRALGFTLAHAVPERGVWRGQSVLLDLREGATADERVVAAGVAQHAAFETGDPFGGSYPGSLMGAIALIRQSLLDARWHATAQAAGQAVEANLALPALQPVLGGQPVWWRLQDELDAGRAAALSSEFRLSAVLLGTGAEYRVLPQLQKAARPLVLPLTFPEAPAIDRPTSALAVSLADLQHWEQAPANPARAVAAGLRVALTSSGLGADTFWPALRRAVAAGLSEDTALAALTTVPAALLGQNKAGRIVAGAPAHLTIADAGLFRAAEAKVHEVWIDGYRHELVPAPALAGGRWALSWSDGRGPAELTVSSEPLQVGVGELRIDARQDGPRLRFTAPADWFGAAQPQPVDLLVQGDRLAGSRSGEGGQAVAISGRRLDAATVPDKAADTAPKPIAATPGYPAGAYALAQTPPAGVVLLRGATVWTQGPQGRLADADVLLRDGRIVEVGHGLRAPAAASVVEAVGKHITPGLIDAHSHTAVARNVNEPSHAVTSEVRIGDALDPTDISIYRQLASGVTSALLLHGSANPIGGQSETVKWRWGAGADALRFAGAPGGIKFALGENVKQSNWGERFVTRYPQTRMGVETLMRDRFNAARAYAAEHAAWAKSRKGPAPRRDLRLEALVEILDGKRKVHIHSYRQDEILMFARLSQDYGFRVGTFTHILEGYKVADVLAEIGAGASTFADWWAYKMEVYDGIPYNAAMLAKQGVVTSLNSDSDELARRLNVEAAKAVKYGGVDEQAALAMVTANPAAQLGVADRVGSLEAGKDADLVVWSGHPLSSLSRVEATYVDGRRYFSLADDAALRARDAAERERLVAAVLASRDAGNKDAAKDEAAAGAKDAPAPPVSLLQHAAHRGLYHRGSDIVGCSVAGHQH
jgi:imidazolonepropionase-like amidohydrolase